MKMAFYQPNTLREQRSTLQVSSPVDVTLQCYSSCFVMLYSVAPFSANGGHMYDIYPPFTCATDPVYRNQFRPALCSHEIHRNFCSTQFKDQHSTPLMCETGFDLVWKCPCERGHGLSMHGQLRKLLCTLGAPAIQTPGGKSCWEVPELQSTWIAYMNACLLHLYLHICYYWHIKGINDLITIPGRNYQIFVFTPSL